MVRVSSSIIGVGIVLCLFVGVLLGSSRVLAQDRTADPLASLGNGFTYQGELKIGDSPVDAQCDFRFKLFDAAAGGSQVGVAHTANNVDVTHGRFAVILNGSGEFGANAFVGMSRWLEIEVRCPTGSGNYTTLIPRQELTAAPYALYAINAGSVSWSGLTGLSCNAGQLVAWNGSKWQCIESNAHDHGGQTWVGTGLFGLRIENTSVANASSAITGISTAITGQTCGVLGGSSSNLGSGVRGEGVGAGVSGLTTATVMGGGLIGGASSTIGAAAGVIGESKAINGTGVLAFSTATSGSDAVGVYGEVSASGGRGVVGRAIHPTGSNVGIYGETASPNGYAGYFVGPVVIQGPLGVNGDLVVSGAKFFQIDHPLDPDSKWLRHAAVESPGMLNLYNGNVVLDENGESWVQLPDYFEALNQDFRYQLTAMGAPGPNLYIAEEINDNRFKIAGGAPGLTVSWQVTGVRHDSYAQAHPLVVEEDKQSVIGATTLSQPAWNDAGRTDIRSWLEQVQQTQSVNSDSVSGWEGQ